MKITETRENENNSRAPKRHVIPKAYRINRSSKKYTADQVRSCTRLLICGSCSKETLEKIARSLHIAFRGCLFGGFSMFNEEHLSGTWEAMVTFQKNKTELPCCGDIEKFLEHIGMNCSVDVMDDRVTHSVLACVHRLRKLTHSIGKFPIHLTVRLNEFKKNEEVEKENDMVYQLTGMTVTAKNMLRLVDANRTIRNLFHVQSSEIGTLRNRLVQLQRSLIQPGTEQVAQIRQQPEAPEGTGPVQTGSYSVFLRARDDIWRQVRVGQSINAAVVDVMEDTVRIRLERPSA
jgi:hypothetical protein